MLHFRGRLDLQVKLNGFRIGSARSRVIASLPEIAAAAVARCIRTEDRTSWRMSCRPNRSGTRRFARASRLRAPGRVPAPLHGSEEGRNSRALPMTGNGKLDRRACREEIGTDGLLYLPVVFLGARPAVVPAAVLGFRERIKYYGFAASCVMVGLLFAGSPPAPLRSRCFSQWRSRPCVRRSPAGRAAARAWRCTAHRLSRPSPARHLQGGGGVRCEPAGLHRHQLPHLQGGAGAHRNPRWLIDDLGVVDYLYFLTFFATFTSGPIDRSRRFGRRRQTASDQSTPTSSVRASYSCSPEPCRNWCCNDCADGPRPFRHRAACGRAGGDFDSRAGAGATIAARTSTPCPLLRLCRLFARGGGASYCFGIATPHNFRAPFAAQDMKDFWNRWHITLSTWLRDFVFMRFVRMTSKRKLFSSRLHTACAAYLVDMLLMGAWHGLTVDYLAYGLYHGVLLALTEVYQKRSAFYKRNKRKRWYRALSWFVTMQLVVIGFALFSGQLTHIIERIING
ncbi:MAG: MBOAT family O-acyltransferase [Collinsella intestinalis]